MDEPDVICCLGVCWVRLAIYSGTGDWLRVAEREIILLEVQIIRPPTTQDKKYIKIMICSASF